MYYEERVINGILHWRGVPDGEWIEKTPEQLTEHIEELQRENEALINKNVEAEEAVEAIEAIRIALKCTKTS